MEYSKSMFAYWTEDDFASSFRKMLTLEQFRNEEMQRLHQQYLVSWTARRRGCVIFPVQRTDSWIF